MLVDGCPRRRRWFGWLTLVLLKLLMGVDGSCLKPMDERWVVVSKKGDAQSERESQRRLKVQVVMKKKGRKRKQTPRGQGRASE